MIGVYDFSAVDIHLVAATLVFSPERSRHISPRGTQLVHAQIIAINHVHIILTKEA
jgi:hypothetical protein